MAAKQLVSPPNPVIQWVTPNYGSPKPTDGTLSSVAFRLMSNLVNAVNGSTNASNISQVVLGNGVTISSGSGSPNGVLAGNIGDMFLSTSGGAGSTLFVKESGVPGTTSGWVGK